MSLAAYAPEQSAPKQAEAAAQSAMEEQLALQHKQPAQLSQLERKGSNLLIDGDTVLLEGLAPTTAVKRHDAGGVVLGFEVANGAVASYDFPVGKLKSERFLSCARCKLWWMTPEWGRTASDLPPETQFMLVEVHEGGPYALILPLIDSNLFRGTLRPPRPDNKLPFDETLLYLRMESGDPTVMGSKWPNSVYIAAGPDPFALIEKSVAAAAQLSGGAQQRQDKRQPDSLNWFGWCTWDAYYSKVSARGLHEGLKTLSDGGTPPKLLIIDDGWQCTDVDVPLRKPLTSRMMMLKEMQESMEGTQDEFIDAELEWLARSAKDLPPSSSAGSALQNLSADEEVLEKEYKGIPRLRETLNIKGKPRTKHQKGTYRRGRNLSKTTPISNNSQVLEATTTPFQSESFDLDFADQATVDDPLPGQQISNLKVQRPQGTVLAPSPSQQGQQTQQEQYTAKSAQQYSQRQPASREDGSNAIDSSQGGKSEGSVERQDVSGAQDGDGQESASSNQGLTSSNALATRDAGSKGQGVTSSRPNANNALATRDAGDQAAGRLQEPLQEEPQQGYSLMWLISALTQRLVGGVVGLLEAALIKFYQYVVDPADPDTWPIRFFTWAATGPIKSNLLEFYASSGDFTRRLTSVKANGKFSSPSAGAQDYWTEEPERLGDVVASLRQLWGLKHIYCWHGLAAYWSGVAPGSDEAGVAKYDARILYATPTPGLAEVEPSMNWNPSVVAGIGVVADPAVLYQDMHSYLAASGITGVKVDCQAGVGLIGSALGGGPAVAQQYHRALEQSIKDHFPTNDCINCMCHSTENFYRFSDTAVARVSDDFYPRDPASSSPHLAACSYNSLLMGVLIQPDWDMFHSRHPAAGLHAAARAVSGAAVYVSDKPGQHDFSILKQLVLQDGSVLRALLPGRPTADCLFKDPLRDKQTVLKVWNVNKYSGVVGMFNIQGSTWSRSRRQFIIHDKSPPPLQTAVKPADIPLFATSSAEANSGHSQASSSSDGNGSGRAQYAVYCNVTDELKVMCLHEEAPVSVPGGSSAVATIAHVMQHQHVEAAVIGLSNMLNGGGAILGCSLQNSHQSGSKQSSSGNNNSSQSSVQLNLVIKGHGTLLLYSNCAPSSVTAELGSLPFDYDQAKGRLTVSLAGEHLQQDVVVSW